ncbi:MAG: TonB-dependent receptor, partial [Syntrophothermus sp.]
MRFIFTFFLLLLMLLLPFFVLGQSAAVSGKITDEQTGDPVPFVNIGVSGQHIGTYTDANGKFLLETGNGDFTLIISCVGYEKLEKPVSVNGKTVLNLELKSTSNELNTVVVSASKYEQKIQESISSIEVMKSSSIEIANLPSVDKAVDRLPGVAIVNNEPQIRGGSGFSSGLGSRVMVMVDEIPLLRGDAGRPVWTMLPIDDVEQIEVVKGASSVVYGSSAINGVINVRTSWPGEKAETRINSFAGMYSKPERRYTTPWTGMNPMTAGISIYHSQQFDNKDICAGASYFTDQSYIGGVPESKAADTLFNDGQYDKRIKFYINTRVRSRKINGLTYGLNGNFLYSESAQTFFWFDADTNIYRSFPGSLSLFKETTFYVDPYVKYFADNGDAHIFRNRVYYSNSNAALNQSSSSVTVFDEYQYSHKFRNMGDLMLMAGVANTYVYSYGQVFSGILGNDGTTNNKGVYGTFVSENLAGYLQLEKKFFNRLNVLAGARYEYFELNGYTDSRPIFRFGVNLQAGKGTFIRASVGQGFRFPGIGERYITTTSGNFGFYPNPELKSESSVSYELGVKQLFKFSKVSGIFDVAGFYTDYNNYVEFNFGYWGRDTIATRNLGFKFFNTGPARIYGIDMTLNLQLDLTKRLKIGAMAGYTYSIPQAKDPNYAYYTYTNIGRQITYLNSSSDATNNILKYRVQELLKADVQVNYGRVFVGLGGRFYGFMQNIDKFFYEVLDGQMFGVKTGIKKYREEHNTGTMIVDFRTGITVRNFKLSLIVNNLMNKEFSL